MTFVDVFDTEEEESEAQVDYMLNSNTEDDDQGLLPSSHVHYPPQYMTNMNLNEDDPSLDIFYNMYMQSKDGLKVGDMFRTKEYCCEL